MAVQLASEEKMLIDMVRDLAREKVAPRAAEIDAKGEFPWDMKELLAQQDIFAMPFPEEYGGLGSSELSILMVIEELAKACATTSLLLCVQQLGSLPILLAGTDEQKQRFIPKLASGEWLASYALTEPGSGSDAGAMRTRAEKRGDNYVLNGLKHFITNAGVAHINTVFAVTSDQGTRGISAFVVEGDRPGFHMGKVENKMGIRGSQTGELVFEDCEIPAETCSAAKARDSRSRWRRLTARAQASRRRRSASLRARSTSRWNMRSSGCSLASRFGTIRRSSSCWPIWISRWRRRASSSTMSAS